MFSHHSDQLVHKAREQADLLARLTVHLIERDFPAMALNLTQLNANTAEIQRIAAAAAVGDSAQTQAAVTAAETADQAALDTATAAQASDIAPLTAAFPPAAAPVAGSLTLSPASFIASVGIASGPDPLSITGGDGSYTLVSPPSGMTLGASGVSFDGTQTAFSGNVTVQDGGAPGSAVTGELAVSIA